MFYFSQIASEFKMCYPMTSIHYVQLCVHACGTTPPSKLPFSTYFKQLAIKQLLLVMYHHFDTTIRLESNTVIWEIFEVHVHVHKFSLGT